MQRRILLHPLEEALVAMYVVRAKAERYRLFLSDPERRPEFLDLLNHTFDYRAELAEGLPRLDRNQESAYLLETLRDHGCDGACHALIDGGDPAGRDLPLEAAIEMLLDGYFGGMLICPPKPVVLYKPEPPGGLILLRPR